ncbi:MAG: four helix bundle protein [Cyanobacteria bacterium J06636_16]
MRFLSPDNLSMQQTLAIRETLQHRSRSRILQLVESLPRKPSNAVMGKQLLRCATSVGANACSPYQTNSTADLIARPSLVK